MDQNLDFLHRSALCDMPYREAGGSLLYLLVGSRLDILYAIARLAKYVESQKLLHCSCIERVFRHLDGTKEPGLEYTQKAKLNPTVCVDADWASNKKNRQVCEWNEYYHV